MPSHLLDPPKPEAMSSFANAIRSKPNWYRKILDVKRKLGMNWAVEAGLLALEDVLDARSLKVRDILSIKFGPKWIGKTGLGNTTLPEGRETVFACLRELKEEAHRIIYDDHLPHLTSRHLRSHHRIIDFRVMDAAVRKRLNFIGNSQHAIRSPRMRENVGVFMSDGLVPLPLHQEPVAELNSLAELLPKDFHPGTFGKVQDLIHPSLYPFVTGETTALDCAAQPQLINGTFQTTMKPGDFTFRSQYAWIPTIFRISDDGGDVHIDSYINGLGPRKEFPVLYRLIEKTFLFVLPHLQRTLDFKYRQQDSPSVRRWNERSHLRESATTTQEWNLMLRRQKADKQAELTNSEAEQANIENKASFEKVDLSLFKSRGIRGPFHGETLKVIVKAANYILRPGEEYSGTWHIEGMPHERIVASAIYYYDADPEIVDLGLALRRLRQPKEFPYALRHESFSVQIAKNRQSKASMKASLKHRQELGEMNPHSDVKLEEFWSLRDYPSDWEEVTGSETCSTSNLSVHINVGTVNTSLHLKDIPNKTTESSKRPASTGRIVSFPNWLQHKVVGVTNRSPESESPSPHDVAKRKILCFFLVDDNDLSQDKINYPGFSYLGLADVSVLTSKDVPSQARACNFPTLRWLLPNICRQLTDQNLPADLTAQILQSADFGINREMAEIHRRELMKERQVNNSGADSNLLPYSLCEH